MIEVFSVSNFHARFQGTAIIATMCNYAPMEEFLIDPLAANPLHRLSYRTIFVHIQVSYIGFRIKKLSEAGLPNRLESSCTKGGVVARTAPSPNRERVLD